MLGVPIESIINPELVSLAITKTIAKPVTRELDLGSAGQTRLTWPTRVETLTFTAKSAISKQWATSWCNKKELNAVK